MAWATVPIPTAATAITVITVATAAAAAVAAATAVTVAVVAAAINTVAAAALTAATSVAACCPGGGDVKGYWTRVGIEQHPEDVDVLRGWTRGKAARNRGAMGHGLLSFMAARESIGRIPFHQASTCENPPRPRNPGKRASDADLVC